MVTDMPEPEPLPSRSPSPPEDIAAAMGFSSFGAKPNPPKKKRRLADPNGEGSGSNDTPLGVRTRTLGGQKAGEEEEEEGQRQGQLVGTGLGGLQGQKRWSHHLGPQENSTALNALRDPDPLAAAALDEAAGMLLETGLLPQHLDWNEGFAEGGRHDGRNWRGQGGGGGAGEEMRRQGKRGNGEWDWQALRKGVLNGRGDVAFYDGSFVEDPWRDTDWRGRDEIAN
ncbi:MAG: hypothetical protein ASARMPRED_004502 [Alectoria sarmentosa]|nr:MAG: hypothetical protein ASARMPRED_004502 [Alectoria sarmentosa]